VAWAKDDVIFDVTWPGVSRERIALFSEGTEDPNPIHVDEAFARRAAFPTVLQQGPMTTAHFARLLEEHVGRGNLEVLDVNFTAPVFPDEVLRLVATVSEPGARVTCALAAAKADGTETARGQAIFRAGRRTRHAG
jgi:acyl dehydratase